MTDDKLEMAPLTTVKFESNTAFEQLVDPRCTIRYMIKQPPCCFNVIANRPERLIAAVTQQPARQARYMIMVDLRSRTLAACGALAFLPPQKKVEFFNRNAVTKPQIPRALRTKPLQNIRESLLRCTGRALRSFVTSTGSAAFGAPCFDRTIRLSTETATEPTTRIRFHKALLTMLALCFFPRRALITARAAAKAPTALFTNPHIQEFLATPRASSNFALLTTKASSYERPYKRLAALSASRGLSHSAKLSPGTDNRKEGS